MIRLSEKTEYAGSLLTKENGKQVMMDAGGSTYLVEQDKTIVFSKQVEVGKKKITSSLCTMRVHIPSLDQDNIILNREKTYLFVMDAIMPYLRDLNNVKTERAVGHYVSGAGTIIAEETTIVEFRCTSIGYIMFEALGRKIKRELNQESVAIEVNESMYLI